MYTGILHTHRLVVILFLIIYLIKTVLLLTNKAEALEKFTKRFKVPEMIISFLFLLTGVFMLVNKYPALDGKSFMFLSIKIIAVLVSIPIAVIGFKHKNKILASLSLVLIFAAYGLAEMGSRAVEAQTLTVVTDPTAADYDQLTHGKAIYENYCIACHQEDGKGGVAGAKSLVASQLEDQEIHELVRNGKNAMPPYKKVLSEQDISAITAYVKTFRE